MELFKKQKDQFTFSTDSKESIPDMDADVLFYFTYKADNAKENENGPISGQAVHYGKPEGREVR